MSVALKRNLDDLASAESMVNDDPREITDFPVGTVAEQGDLYMVSIDRPMSLRPRKDRQMAEGDTMGSRHVVSIGDVFSADPGEVCKLIKQANGVDVQPQYIGPLFQTVNGMADLVHPEHGDHLYRCDATVAVVFQRVLDSELREQRARD